MRIAPSTERRPAHRPSRRNLVVEGAMDLFSTLPVDEVTVGDIAASVDMTSAAVYYHFASKEQILLEGMVGFRDAMIDVLGEHLPVDGDPEAWRTLVVELLRYVEEHRPNATVYFVNSIGLNLTVEALRRRGRVEVVDILRDAIEQSWPDRDSTEAGVSAVVFMSLMETAIVAMLREDVAYRGFGRRRFSDEVAAVALRILGAEPS